MQPKVNMIRQYQQMRIGAVQQLRVIFYRKRCGTRGRGEMKKAGQKV